MAILWKMIFGAVGKIAPWVWGLLAALIVAFLLYKSVHSDGVAQGGAAVTIKAEKDHAQREKNAARMESKVNDCFASGGTWDRTRSECVRDDK